MTLNVQKNNIFKILDVEINYDKLIEEYHSLKIDKLLINNRNHQISVQTKKGESEDTQLYSGTGSLWLDWDNLDEVTMKPKLKNIDIKEIHSSNVDKNIFNLKNHQLLNEEPVIKTDSNKNSIAVYVQTLNENQFYLSEDREGKKVVNFNSNKNIVYQLYRDVSEFSFVEICSYFKGTYLQEVVDKINKLIPICRGRFILNEPKTCLSWHTDFTSRIHIPIYTSKECFMVVEDTVLHLPVGHVYHVNTKLYHTAVNAGLDNRVHLVFCCQEAIEVN